MEEQPSDEGELSRPSSETNDQTAPGEVPADEPRLAPEAQALAMEAEEIRRLVDAGAGTPEALRELAARLRAHRAREEALWRAEIKPALVKENKGRLRGHGKPAAEPTERTSTSNALTLGAVLLGLVAIVVIAANTSVWLLVLPVLALIAWAWYQGRDAAP